MWIDLCEKWITIASAQLKWNRINKIHGESLEAPNLNCNWKLFGSSNGMENVEPGSFAKPCAIK